MSLGYVIKLAFCELCNVVWMSLINVNIQMTSKHVRDFCIALLLSG